MTNKGVFPGFIGLMTIIALSTGDVTQRGEVVTGANQTDTVKLAVSGGWNLVSIPVIVPDGRVSALFPDAISHAFDYHEGYNERSKLSYLTGYWLKFAAPETVAIIGTIDPLDTISVATGWNLIGAAARTPVIEIISQPAGIVMSSLFGYRSGSAYVRVDTLEPGKAYWVKCRVAGMLVLATPGPPGPQLIFPVNRASDQPTALTLRWHSLQGTSAYHLQVAVDPLFSNLITNDSTLTDTTSQLCNLPLASTFFWRVQAKFSGGSMSGWSATWSFQTVGVPFIPAPTTLFTYVGGVPGGWFLFDPNTFEKLDSLRVPDGSTPAFVTAYAPIEFSPDDSLWYTLMRSSSSAPESLYAIGAYSKQTVHRRGSSYGLWMDRNKKYLIQSGGALHFIDRKTFTLAVVDSTAFGPMAASSVTESLYGIASVRVIGVYNIDSFRLARTISIDSTSFLWNANDMKMSADGNNLFLTAQTSVNTFWQGTFYHIDLNTDSVVAALPCGRYAQLGVSPDGRSVYVADPAGFTQDYIPTGRFLRYNVQSRTIDIFIDWGQFAEITGVISTEQVNVASDNRSIFVTVNGGRTCSQPYLDLVKIDAETKNVLGTLRFPLDSLGHRNQRLLGFKIGRYNR